MPLTKIGWLAVSLTLCGCGCRTAPITLHRYSHINNVSEFVQHATTVIHAEGCEVDRIDYGCRNGTFIPVTVTGRYKSNAEICSERMYEYRDRARKAEAALADAKGERRTAQDAPATP